jgi:hypothetical protein
VCLWHILGLIVQLTRYACGCLSLIRLHTARIPSAISSALSPWLLVPTWRTITYFTQKDNFVSILRHIQFWVWILLSIEPLDILLTLGDSPFSSPSCSRQSKVSVLSPNIPKLQLCIWQKLRRRKLYMYIYIYMLKKEKWVLLRIIYF